MHVYFVEAFSERHLRQIKIGKARDPVARLAELQIGSAVGLRLLGSIACESDAAALLIERRLHVLYAAQRRRGEWFRLRENQRAAILRLCDPRHVKT